MTNEARPVFIDRDEAAINARRKMRDAAEDLYDSLYEIMRVTNLKDSGHPIAIKALAALKKAEGAAQ